MRHPEGPARRRPSARPSALERLEDRRLLSHPGMPPPGDFGPWAASAQVGRAAPIGMDRGAPGDFAVAIRAEGSSIASPVQPDARGEWAAPRSLGPSADPVGGGTVTPLAVGDRDPGAFPRGPLGPPVARVFIMLFPGTQPTAGASFGPRARSAEFEAPAPGTGAGPALPDPTAGGSASIAAATPAGAAPDASAVGAGHSGADAPAAPPGQGSTGVGWAGQGLPAVADVAKGLALGERATPGPDGEPSPGAALGTSRETGGDRSADGRQEIAPDPAGRADGPSPREADLLTDFQPFDRAALEGAIDRFLGHFDGLDASLSLPDLPRPIGLIPAALSAAGGLLAWELALRLRRMARDEDLEADPEDGFVRFPGLPDFRS